jgi:hypothetical protein
LVTCRSTYGKIPRKEEEEEEEEENENLDNLDRLPSFVGGTGIAQSV